MKKCTQTRIFVRPSAVFHGDSSLRASARVRPSASPAFKDPEYFRGVSRRTANQACCRDLPRPPHVLASALRVFGVIVTQPYLPSPRVASQLGASDVRLCFVSALFFFYLAPRPEMSPRDANDEKMRSFVSCNL